MARITIRLKIHILTSYEHVQISFTCSRAHIASGQSGRFATELLCNTILKPSPAPSEIYKTIAARSTTAHEPSQTAGARSCKSLDEP
jgi:hypothetical protein